MTEVAASPATENQEATAEKPKVGGPTKIKFYFKSRKEMQKVKDEATGKEVEKEVTIPKADPVELTVPLLSLEDVIDILSKNDEKETSLVLEALNGIILSQARSMVDEDVEKARKEGIDNTQLTWNFIANIPPATRRGGGIPDEVWEEFVKDYVAVMVHHGKTEEKAATGAKLLAKRFTPVKDQKKVVSTLKENLMVWFSNTEKAEDFTQVYESLMSKADTLLAKDEDAIVAAI